MGVAVIAERLPPGLLRRATGALVAVRRSQDCSGWGFQFEQEAVKIIASAGCWGISDDTQIRISDGLGNTRSPRHGVSCVQTGSRV